MADDPLVLARKRAERAVEGMADGPLKIAAFQAILTKLLAESDPGEQVQRGSVKAPVGRVEQPDTLTGRILVIRSEGFFKTQRSLGEVREALGSRGWHYPLTTLSGVMQRLVRQRQLRRERGAAGNKNVWKYSNP
jgi:hypothetical protein